MSNKNRVVVPTGYMGSGSSAITDLLNGVDGFDVSRSTFEFVFLHCPNGVFDLEDKLLHGNNAVRSDEALHSFYNTMKQLYSKRYWWVGHYNQHIGKEFWSETEKYLDGLIEYKPDYYWYYQENVNFKMVPRLMLNKIIKKLPGMTRFVKKPLAYSPMWVSFVKPERFYELSKKYIYNVFDAAGKGEKNIVLDQLLLPFNLFRFSNYFDDDVEVFVVERDPRDVFIINKYYWNKMGEVVPYPTDVNEFCTFYQSLREMEKPCEHKQVHRIAFEDLVYYHDETVQKIFEVLDIDIHKKYTVKFDPAKSINNTQLFLQNNIYKEECKVIEKELKKYLYPFPYEIEHNEKNIF